MAEYKSSYTGQEIDSGIGKANTSVQPTDLYDYQTKTDASLQTSSRYIVGAINELNTKFISVYRFKGTVSTYSSLPSTGLSVGDVYNIMQADAEHDIKAGDNVAWTDPGWDNLGGTVDLSGYQTLIDSSHKLSADLVDDASSTNKFVTAADKTAWNGKSVVSGTNDGTNWTSLTIGSTTKAIPAPSSPQLIATKTIDTNVDAYAPTIGFPTITTIQPGHYYFVTSFDGWGAPGNIVEGVMEFTVFTGTSSPATTGQRNAHFGSGSIVFWQDGNTPSPSGSIYAEGVSGMMDMDYDPQNNFCMNVNFDDVGAGVEFNDGAVIKVYYKPL